MRKKRNELEVGDYYLSPSLNIVWKVTETSSFRFSAKTINASGDNWDATWSRDNDLRVFGEHKTLANVLKSDRFLYGSRPNGLLHTCFSLQEDIVGNKIIMMKDGEVYRPNGNSLDFFHVTDQPCIIFRDEEAQPDYTSSQAAIDDMEDIEPKFYTWDDLRPSDVFDFGTPTGEEFKKIVLRIDKDGEVLYWSYKDAGKDGPKHQIYKHEDWEYTIFSRGEAQSDQLNPYQDIDGEPINEEHQIVISNTSNCEYEPCNIVFADSPIALHTEGAMRHVLRHTEGYRRADE